MPLCSIRSMAAESHDELFTVLLITPSSNCELSIDVAGPINCRLPLIKLSISSNARVLQWVAELPVRV